MAIKQKNIGTIQTVVCVVYIFCYIFSFYIIKPINSAIVVGIFALLWIILSRNFLGILHFTGKAYFLGVISFQIFLISLSIIFSIMHGTMDMGYIGILFSQIIHVLVGLFIIYFLYNKFQMSSTWIIKLIIICYIVQSLIELAASAIPPLAAFMKNFTGDDLQDRYNGVRGLALTSAAGWSLGLTYGIIFILYIRYIFCHRTNVINIGYFIILIIGCFFAGRTGLVGLFFGFLYFCLFGKFWSGISILTKFILIASVVIFFIFTFFYDYYEFARDYILPFALEPLYNLLDGKGLTSKSTNRLEEMWQVPFTDSELLLGTGHLTEPDGSYYRHTDVGIFRNILYWGITGYVFVVFYQLYLIYPALKNKETRSVMIFILLYLILCECKAVTIGFNKMTFSILFLINSVILINSTSNKRNEKNICHSSCI